MANQIGKVNIDNKSSLSKLNTSTDAAGAYYLAERPEYYEPQRANTFKFVVTNLNIDLTDFGIDADRFPSSEVDKTLELSVKASSVPHFEIEPLTINRGNSQMKFAGKPTFKDGQLSVRDYIGAHTKEILLAWQRQAYNVKTEKVGLASDYKRTATLYELTPDYQVIRSWKLYGCWVASISEGNYDHDSSEAKLMDVGIVYDYAVVE